MISSQEIKIAMDACRAADRAILEIYNNADFEVEMKGDHSPLTRADRASHEAIMKHLTLTGVPVLSEEGKSISYEERKKWKRFWLVDPLDGTKEFIKRNGEFTVNIALIEEHRPVWGIVSAPVLNKTYFIDDHGKVFMQSAAEKVALPPIAKNYDSSLRGIRVVASRSHMDDNTRAFVAALQEPQIVSMGSSLKFMMLAEGKADVYPRFAPTSEWDTAAAHAILNALGIRVLREGSAQEELAYNKENILNPGFIAYRTK